jgi:molybdopterin converting factor small subunit
VPLRVTLFGQLRHFANADAVERPVPEDGALMSLLRGLAADFSEDFARVLLDGDTLRSSVLVLVNDAPIDKAAPPTLREGDQVTLLPAISGG